MPTVSKNEEFPELARASRGAESKAPSNKPKTGIKVPDTQDHEEVSFLDLKFKVI